MKSRKLRLINRLLTAVAVAALLLAFLMEIGTAANPRIQGIMLLLAMAALIGKAVIQHRVHKQQRAEQQKMPKRSIHVTVLSKRTTFRVYGRGRMSTSTGRDAWFVAFRTSRGEMLEMEVPYDVYLAATEGLQGTLTYKGGAFVAFRKG